MQLPVTPNYENLDISLSFPFLKTLSVQLFFCEIHCFMATQNSPYIHLYFNYLISNSNKEWKGVWI